MQSYPIFMGYIDKVTLHLQQSAIPWRFHNNQVSAPIIFTDKTLRAGGYRNLNPFELAPNGQFILEFQDDDASCSKAGAAGRMEDEAQGEAD